MRDLQAQEHKHLGKDPGLVRQRIDAKRLKGSDHNEDGRPAVVERKGKVDPD